MKTDRPLFKHHPHFEPDKAWVLLWSQKQGYLHIETLTDMLKSHSEAFRRNTDTLQYIPLMIGDRDVIDEMAESIRETVDKRRQKILQEREERREPKSERDLLLSELVIKLVQLESEGFLQVHGLVPRDSAKTERGKFLEQGKVCIELNRRFEQLESLAAERQEPRRSPAPDGHVYGEFP